MSFILDALKRSARDKQLSTDVIGGKPQHWEGSPSGQQYGGTLRHKLSASVLPYAKMLIIGALALTLSSAVTWASMVYFNDSDSMTVQNGTLQVVRNDVYGSMINSTTAGKNVSSAMPVNADGLGAFLSDEMDQTREEAVGTAQEEQREMTGVDYRTALLEEDTTSAAPAINSPLENEDDPYKDLYAADGIFLDGVSYHSMSVKRRAILRRAGETEGEVVKVGDMYRGLEVAAIHNSNISLKKGINRFVIHLD